MDKIYASKGYVEGNVVVISHRANSIKSDASHIEIQQVATWLREFIEEQADEK